MRARLTISSCLIALAAAAPAAAQAPGTSVGGEVPGLLGLSVAQPDGLATLPSGRRPMTSSFAAVATSTEPGASLAVADGDVTRGARLGRLTAGGRPLAAPLEVRSAGAFGPLGVGRIVVPFSDVIATRAVTVRLRQRLAARDPRRGTLRKTLIASLTAPPTAPTAARAATRASSAAAPGRLTLSPAVIATVAAPGPVATFEVRNATAAALGVTVTTRPWRQERTGAIIVDRGASLARWARPDAERFDLAPGAARAVAVTVTQVPPRGSLYGALDVVARPSGARRAGVTTVTSLAGALRLAPTRARTTYRLIPGTVRASGRRLVLPLRNAGSTADAVRGSLRLTGPGVRRTISLPATTILPGASVDVPLGLRPRGVAGTWRISYRLTQAGRTVASGARTIRLR